MLRLAGAQIPVASNIQLNKIELFKAIDWAKENGVDHLLTPEGSLSGYQDINGREKELVDALREVELHARGLSLHLGTIIKEKEETGYINRNEIRHYKKEGGLSAVTHKTYCIPQDRCVGKIWSKGLEYFNVDGKYKSVGMICNDMWGAADEIGIGFCERHLVEFSIELIFHATNGIKFSKHDKRWEAFDAYADGFLRMTAFKSKAILLTVDSCVPWTWNGEEDKLEECPTSSESGVLYFTGWKTKVPRFGRQYFYHDLDMKLPGRERFNRYNGRLIEQYPYKNLNFDALNAG